MCLGASVHRQEEEEEEWRRYSEDCLYLNVFVPEVSCINFITFITRCGDKDGSRYWGVFAHRENSFDQLMHNI